MMVLTRAVAAFAMLVLTGLAARQNGQDEEEARKLLPTATEMLTELQHHVPQETLREVRILITLDQELRNRASRKLVVDGTFARVRKERWERLLRGLVTAYKDLGEASDPPLAMMQALFITIPCIAESEGIAEIHGSALLRREEFTEIADELIHVARTPEDGLLGHIYKLHRGDREVRIREAVILAQMEPAADILPHLMEGLEDEDVRVVQETITALGMMGAAAKDAIPSLDKLTKHDNEQIVQRAKAALKQVRKESVPGG